MLLYGFPPGLLLDISVTINIAMATYSHQQFAYTIAVTYTASIPKRLLCIRNVIPILEM